MAVILTEDQKGDAEGVTLPQLAELVERALQECQHRGVDAATVVPKVRLRFSGQMRQIRIEV